MSAMANDQTNTLSGEGHVIGEVPDDSHLDLVILMGATGSGKSSFINLLAGSPMAQVGHTSESTTHEMQQVNYIMDNRQICIVDSPGFDDTHLDDYEILKRITEWLTVTYQNGVRVTGIIYLREITETRMRGSTMKNFTMFTKLCGTDTLSNVVFVTTKWDVMGSEPETRAKYEARQEEMRNVFLKKELGLGAKLLSHDNTIQSATGIVRTLLGNPPVVLNIQRQLVDNKQSLRETDAGEELNTELTKEREKLAQQYADGLAAAQAAHNEDMKRMLEQANDSFKEELDRIDRQKKALEEEGELARQQRVDELDQGVVAGAQERGQTKAAFLKDLFTSLAPVVIPAAVAAYTGHRKWQAESQQQADAAKLKILEAQRQTAEAQARQVAAEAQARQAAQQPQPVLLGPLGGLFHLLSIL